MSYEDLVDASNPFTRTGLSREVRSILGYVQAARRATGWDIVCTSTTDHPKYTASGNLSRHLMEGTDGLGLAVDLRMRTRSTAVDAHDKVFDIFVPVERRLRELIYAYGPVGRRDDGSTGLYNIRTGKRVAPYATSDHRDHVHLSLVKGVFLEYPQQPATEVRPMYDPPITLAPGVGMVAHLVHPQGLGSVVLLSDGGTLDFGPPHCGNVVNKPYFVGRKPARLHVNPRWDEAGRPHAGNGSLPWYIIEATSGEKYGHGGF